MREDLFASYSEYLDYQIKHACSLEGSIPRYKAGQERFIEKMFAKINRTKAILDCVSGDGSGLICFKAMGFQNVVGIELNRMKAQKAQRAGFEIVQGDMHYLPRYFSDDAFDIVYSSHSLEHALYPDQVVTTFRNILKIDGELFIVLPYPDIVKDRHREKAHCGRHQLGLDILDNGNTVIRYFTNHHFKLTFKQLDSFRESEIWLRFKK